MKWTNRIFGEFEFEEKHILHFPGGIIGFEENKKFIIVNDESSEPFRWLVSLEDPELSFPLIEPSMVHAQFNEQYVQGKDVTLFVVASINEHIETSTVNLKSPLLINNEDRTGKQIILDDEALDVRTPLLLLTDSLAG
ncbi:MAG: flagellar assembly protein FliW [Bacteroidetes bacterium]|nr:flagellar assembly protein FliW [Bacteroidota bacterium]